jgi:hypothetical protein
VCAPSENKPVCFGQWGILKVSEFGGFVLRSVIFLKILKVTLQKRVLENFR